MYAVAVACEISHTRDDPVVAGRCIICVFNEGFASHTCNIGYEFFHKYGVKSTATQSGSKKSAMNEMVIFTVMDQFAPFITPKIKL